MKTIRTTTVAPDGTQSYNDLVVVMTEEEAIHIQNTFESLLAVHHSISVRFDGIDRIFSLVGDGEGSLIEIIDRCLDKVQELERRIQALEIESRYIR